VEEGSLFVDDMLIATNNSKNRRNEEGKLDNSIHISKATAGDKTLKNAQIFEGAASRQILDNESSPVNGITSIPTCRKNPCAENPLLFRGLKSPPN
jgi:hypothetical protein